MLRAAAASGTPLGLKAKDIMAIGGLVDDDIVVGIIKDRVSKADCALGFILDGFPRTLVQAKALDEMLVCEGLNVSKVIELHVPDEALVERICGRWIHLESGRSYHIKAAPPRSLQLDEAGNPIRDTLRDDITSELLVQRADDTNEALVRRLKGYHQDTEPILNYYEPKGVVTIVNANQDILYIREEIRTALKGIVPLT